MPFFMTIISQLRNTNRKDLTKLPQEILGPYISYHPIIIRINEQRVKITHEMILMFYILPAARLSQTNKL